MILSYIYKDKERERERCTSCLEQLKLKGAAVERALRLQGWELTHWISSLLTRPSHQIEGGINEASAISGMPSWYQEITLGSYFFPSLEESCEASRGGARRVQSHSQARRLRLEGLQQSSTILDSNIVRFNIPQTLRCCKCSLLSILGVSVSAVWLPSILFCRARSMSSMASKCPWASFCVPEPRFSASPGAWFDN